MINPGLYPGIPPDIVYVINICTYKYITNGIIFFLENVCHKIISNCDAIGAAILEENENPLFLKVVILIYAVVALVYGLCFL